MTNTEYNAVITVNITASEIEAMKAFIMIKESKKRVLDKDANKKDCFSRCEWVRIAVKRLLLKEIRLLKEGGKIREDCEEFNHDHDDFVRVPVEGKGLENEPIREFKTYKIIRRLEY